MKKIIMIFCIILIGCVNKGIPLSYVTKNSDGKYDKPFFYEVDTFVLDGVKCVVASSRPDSLAISCDWDNKK